MIELFDSDFEACLDNDAQWMFCMSHLLCNRRVIEKSSKVLDKLNIDVENEVS